MQKKKNQTSACVSAFQLIDKPYHILSMQVSRHVVAYFCVL